MARLTFHIPTGNAGNGFYGTAWLKGGQATYADKAWDDAFEKITTATYAIEDAPNWPDSKIRDFLDSIWGRHYANHLGGNESLIGKELTQPEYLAKHLPIFAKTYDPADYE